ncbi:diacylglycerol kinase [Lewinella marina]|uniref:Diacylglycerol kinase n=1 Tax=Neolewinella marina TaxID=438751 RepID=A0A2G0CFM6_9BACT|nr:diacylglycerol kinase family protein [Neolewinella marina]NJB85533.1 diacylglycerol kinase [Neolewinella marina]PHK98779.1 diacylglycerol kinase [Neolewinella marina]
MKRLITYSRGRLSAFGYAFRGAHDLLSNHAPSKIHMLAFVGMVAVSWALDFPLWKWVAVLICSGLVLAAEALNTAVEYVVDLVSPDYHVLAGKAKDVAAGAVLFTAVFSGLVALLLIGDSLLELAAAQ